MKACIRYRLAEKSLNSPTFSRPVLQLYINTEQIIAKYPSAREAARQTGFSQGNISACCRGEYNYAYGYKWQYADKNASTR